MTDSETVLLWGHPGDHPMAAVRQALEEGGYRTVFLDQRLVLESEIELCAGPAVSGELRAGDLALDLETIRAVYPRPLDATQLRCVIRAGQDSEAWHRAIEFQEALYLWTELTPALVLNRPSAMASNNSKPYQAVMIEALGFHTPETLITTDPEAAVEFWERHERVIYKSISGVRSIVTQLRPEHREKFGAIVSCPTQFQKYVDGQEYRVHVVGEELFACRVVSDADDYRYSPEEVEFEACELPAEIADCAKKLAAALNLTLAGLDLRHASNGEWYCFEVNPSPAFTAYTRVTGQPIAQAVARLLATERSGQVSSMRRMN